MVQPLRRKRADGTLYRRRKKVEEELERVTQLTLQDVLAAGRAGQRGKAGVSSEALVHLLRREARGGNAQGLGVDGLVSVLIERTESMLRSHISWAFDELQREEILREVVDRVIDEIVDPSDKADYAEVNFNDWLMHNRIDACRKQTRRAERAEQIGDALQNLAENEADIVLVGDGQEAASPKPSPEAAYALAEARATAPLPAQIEAGEFTAEDRYRIASAVRAANLDERVRDAFLLHQYLDVPIDSQDPEKHTLVKHFGMSEKTIRNWLRRAEEAFAKLRGETNERRSDEVPEPGLGAPRLSR
jgi:hypothetical protein